MIILLFPSNLKKYASSPSLQMGPSLSSYEAQVSPNESLQVPIVGYEVMEQRARFTVSLPAFILDFSFILD